MKRMLSFAMCIAISSILFTLTSCDNEGGKTTLVPYSGSGSGSGSINWLGSFPAAPTDPDDNDAYYNSSDGSSYIYNGETDTWDLLALHGNAGDDGADGIPIIWQGPHTDQADREAAHGTATTNAAYYNSTDRASYIYNGLGWDILCQDMTGLNVSGTVTPGNYLALVHNLDRNDLTFTAQYVKNGYIYDYTDYPEYYSIQAPSVFESANTFDISTTALANGNVLIAYRDGGNSNFGTFIIYDSSGSLVAGPTVFDSDYTLLVLSATALANGNVLIAYTRDGTYNGCFVIYTSSGTLVKGPTMFESGYILVLSATALTNGNALITYSNMSGWVGTFVIYDSTGALVAGPTVFESWVTPYIYATALANGNALIAASNGSFRIYDSSGALVAGPTVFESANTSDISATALGNGNVHIAYRDGGNSNFGTFVIYSSSGTLVAGPTVFESADTRDISAIPLTNGNALIAYSDWGNSQYGTFVVYNPSGCLVTGPTVFESAVTSYISATALANGNALIAYRDEDNSGYGTFCIVRKYSIDNSLMLQKVSSNEVRLWNYTNETLELMLSVDR